jgi:hypothetical protein
MSDIDTLVRRYLETFNDTDEKRRRATIEQVFSEECAYVDPHAAVEGREQIDAFIASVQKQFPGLEFRLAGSVDAHHDQARFTWHAGPPGGKPLAVGFDVIVLEKGRIGRVYGFLDAAPKA